MPKYAIHLYQSVQEYSNFLRSHAAFQAIEDYQRDVQIERMSMEILAEKVEAQEHVIVEEPVWKDPKAHYVASMPDGFRKRFLTYFWGLSEDALKPRRITHTVTVERWVEHPFQGVPKQSIEDTLMEWA